MSIPTESSLITALLDISSKMVETRTLEPLLQYAVKLCLEHFGAEYGYLVMVNPDQSLDFHVQLDYKGRTIDQPDQQISHTILHQAINEGEPVLTVSAIEDPQFHEAQSVMKMQLRSVICVPLISRERPLGALYLENRTVEQVFTSKHVEPLRYFASQAAAIIENAMLNEEMDAKIIARTAELQKTNEMLEQEIAERKRVEQRLIDMAVERERAQILTTFIQDVSHQFRTPLSVIQVAVKLLQVKYDIPPEEHNVIQIKEQVQTIVSLLDNMVLLVKLDSRSVEHEFKSIEFNMLVGSQEHHWTHKASQKQHTFTLEKAPHLPLCRGDKDLLLTAVNHLVHNAIQYTPDNGAIHVSTQTDGDHIVFKVKNSGEGIPADKHLTIFQRFYRGDDVGTTRGFGLGLSITQLIIALHQGTLHLESEPGQGSTFTITLPAAK